MGRGRKFKKLAMTDEEEPVAQQVDDGEVSPAEEEFHDSSDRAEDQDEPMTKSPEEEKAWSSMHDAIEEPKEAEDRQNHTSATSVSTGTGSATAHNASNTTTHSSNERWQELAAEAAGAEIEAMHWDQEGSREAAIECYRQVAARLVEAAESLERSHAIRSMLEQRSTEALQRVAALEAAGCGPSHHNAPEAALHREQKAKLVTQGILATTLASTAGTSAEGSSATAALCSEDAKMIGTAATLGAGAGLLLAGPFSAACLGGMAAYATTRQDAAGAAARKVCQTSLNVTDCAVTKAVDTGLKVADVALEESRKGLLDAMEGSRGGPPHSSKAKIKDWCSQNKSTCIKAVAGIEALQGSLPRGKNSEQARQMKMRYPDRVPVLCERGAGARSDLPKIERNKFAVPNNMSFAEFKYIVHKQVTQASRGLAVDETIYLFVGEAGLQPKTSASMGELYKAYGGEDGFLYIRYTAENTLG